ncbi:NAD(P)-dependent oxidoreductase [Zobellia galactanivorans]|uniref:NAD(P)-dependent oxidoreductase n=1 Tax=Zobellia galactanivorans (strain DSM 12802 / CCUG 47099 / CIP 106680 / NCIMB 13871 / Dsij) TaxID=63186 RepID=UPI0026E38A4E|nr:NAD(P)-dependent oxidoreductase [Zobellia galactanivorans]MDO6810950.1 NAD(P)-dependent oxidoreductase [Zobellia galactanivorans]
MKIAIFSTHEFERPYLEDANNGEHELIFIEEALGLKTVKQAEGCKTVVIFSSDDAGEKVLKELKKREIELLTTRSAGTDHINLTIAKELGILISHVPEYSPNAIAEHCIALTLALYRKLKKTFRQIDTYNFSLNNLVGYEIENKTVGICGTGDIGQPLAKLFFGFGAKVLLFDAKENTYLKKRSYCTYVSKAELFKKCDVISLNLPLNKKTENFVSGAEIDKMKPTAILINTGRGELVDTKAVLSALEDKKIAGFGMDVYENEKGIFYKDLSHEKKKNKLLQSLIQRDNVIVTAHQAFLTDNALQNMMETTFENIAQFESGSVLENKID